MSFTLELKDPTKTITVETGVQLDILSERVRAFSAAVDGLNKAVPLASFVAVEIPGRPLVYNYDFVTQDGRTWHQQISFTNGIQMTFAVGTNPEVDGWERAEFVPHRAVRDEFELLVRDAGLQRVDVIYV